MDTNYLSHKVSVYPDVLLLGTLSESTLREPLLYLQEANESRET